MYSLLFLTIIKFCAVMSQFNKYQNVSRFKTDKGGSSLAFVFDTTGSMHDDLEQLREGAELILDTAMQSQNNVISNFVFVPFHDPGVGPATVTKDKQTFKDVLKNVHVYGGGNCPEKSLGGIELALNVSLSRSYVYVFTDATSIDHDLVNNVLDLVQRKQSQVVFVLTGHCNDLDKPSYKVYQQIAAASSGQIFNLNKTSVHKVLEFVRSSLTGRTVNLGSAVNPAGYNYKQQIPVDSTLGEVTVSISGAKPLIKVVNPYGEEIDGPPKLITTLDLSEIMVVKVMDPEPGNWTITVGSEDDYSVKVVGLSNLTFQHGFSVQKPKHMIETSYRPLQGTDNYLMVSLSEIDVPIRITFAEILTLDGKTLFELPLKEIDLNDTKMFLADPFVPPNDFFYIAINGFDENNQELRRIGATAVNAKLPDLPYLTVTSQVAVSIHDTATITCIVESLVPVTVQWYKGNQRLQNPVSNLQSTSVEYTIENMSWNKTGSYRCIAKNEAGVSTATTNVTMLVDPPKVTITTDNVSPTVGDVITITCYSHSETEIWSLHLIHNTYVYEDAIKTDSKINRDGYYIYKKTIEMSEENGGQYTCRAINQGGELNSTLHLNVLSKPKAKFIKKTSTVKLNSVIKLICLIHNGNKVYILAPNGTRVNYIDKIVSNTFEHSFFIQNVSFEHQGTWKCVVENKNYVETDSMILNVILSPITTVEGPKYVNLLYGTDHTIICKITANPTPSVVWYNDTSPINGTPLTTLSKFEYVTRLILNNVSEYAIQTYKCSAWNSEGNSADSVVINVRKNIIVLESLEDQSIKIYSSATLRCNVDSYPKSQIKWYHNNTRQYPNKNVHISSDNATLIIKEMDITDTGLYTCEVSNIYEKILLNSTLSIYGLEAPELIKEPVKMSQLRGSSVIIPCRLLKGKPIPEISWMFGNNSNNFPKDIISRENGLELFISSLDLHHENIYKCIARNVIGQDFYSLQLTVQFPPMISTSKLYLQENNYTELAVGNKLVLKCEVEAMPKPLVVWSKNNESIPFSKNVYLDDESNLMINPVSIFDSGIFACVASNAFGYIKINFSVFVYEPPAISAPQMDSHIEVLEGQLVNLPCAAHGYPVPTLIWTQNGEPVVEDKRKLIYDTFTLRFVANLTDFGEYSCVATNKYGNASLNYTVYIWVAPSIERPLNTMKNVNIGANVSIQCNAVGFPVPKIIWQFEDDILLENSTDLSFNYYGDLFIRDVNIQYEGLFVCIAENVAGLAKKYTYLNVYEPPKIISVDYSGPYIGTNKDRHMFLPCPTSGKPKPSVIWLKDNLKLDRDSRYNIDLDGTLIILSPSEDLSGNYSCVATNIAGVANKTVCVEIYAIPELIQADESSNVITLVEHSSHVLQCPVRSSRGDTLKWYKNGKLLSAKPLKFLNVSRYNESLYACVVTNAIASVSAAVQVNVEWRPTFVNNYTRYIEVIHGNDYYFDCDCDAKPRAQIKWLFDSKPLSSANKVHFRLLNIQLLNNGTYACIVTNAHGTISREFTLNVLVPPYISEFDLLDVLLKEGTNATLDCNAKGFPKPTVMWTYNNTNWVRQNNTLTTVNTSLQSEGLFRCDANNKAGMTKIVYRVILTIPASIKHIIMYTNGSSYYIGNKVEIQHGNRMRLACEAEGNPIPQAHWIRNGIVASKSHSESTYADLIFDEVQQSSAGIYICSVANEYGGQKIKINIDVLEPPKIYKSLFEITRSRENTTEMEIILSQSFYLHCHPYGNPIPEIYWFKDGVPLRLFDGKMYSKEFGEILVSNRALLEQTGNYTCVARNKIGEDSISYLVNVLVPPIQTKDKSTKILSRVGKTVHLICPVQGKPLPDVVWLKQPYTHITDELTPSRLKILDNYTLAINNIEVNDNGKYSCILTNKVGTTEVVYELVVEQPPQILANIETENGENQIIAMQRSVVLKCSAEGHPYPKITWLKDTLSLGPNLSNLQRALNDNLLIIWNARAKDAGQYICIAENNVGSDHRRFNVFVKVPGKWSVWSQWSLCNVTCGLGYQHKSRSCQYVEDDIGIIDKSTNGTRNVFLDDSACKGSSSDRRKCHMPPCEEKSYSRWSVWSKWSICSTTCGVGIQTRTRRCRAGNTDCLGDNVQIRKCINLPPCRETNHSHKEDGGEFDPHIPDDAFITDTNINTDVEIFDPKIGPTNNRISSEEYFVVNVTENLDHSSSGACSPGYRHNTTSNTCDDIDECLIENNHCHSTQICENMSGNYRCSCQAGYTAFGAGQRCLDINECVQYIADCEFACVNVAGGYVCACPRHLRLHTDKHHCVDATRMNLHPYDENQIATEDFLSATVDLPTKYIKNTRT